MFTQKPLGHHSWESLNSHWVRVSWTPALGLHEDNVGPQPIMASLVEKSTWYPTSQVWVMLGGIIRIFFLRQVLKVSMTEFATGI
jgi:hypothetical protein